MNLSVLEILLVSCCRNVFSSAEITWHNFVKDFYVVEVY